MAKIKWSAFFSELPQLVQSAEKIYGTSKGSGKTKKQKVLALVDISAQEAAKAVVPVLDPHSATIAQAASAEVDSIVSGFNQSGWPGATVAGVTGATAIAAAVQEPEKTAAPAATAGTT
jgi:hypothetical protein